MVKANDKKRLRDYLWIFNFNAIFRLHKTNKEWDKFLNRVLDECEITETTTYTMKISEFEVWLGNYPYSFGNFEGSDKFYRKDKNSIKGLPSRSTVSRLKRVVLKHLKKEILKNPDIFHNGKYPEFLHKDLEKFLHKSVPQKMPEIVSKHSSPEKFI